MHSVEVRCPAGTITGTPEKVNPEVITFHSIPYARFDGPFCDASALATGLLIDATAPQPHTTALSISAPRGTKRNADLPVLCYIHGGRFETGDHTETTTNPELLASEGFIVVRVGYRLKFPGFLPFHDDAPGHYRGIHDCQLALQWLQRNIESFGGDPTNITLVGHSAGAAIALWLCRRDHYRGEFRRVLALSPAFPRREFSTRKWAARGALGKALTRDCLNELAQRAPHNIERGYQRFRTQYFTDIALGPSPFSPEELAAIPIVVSSTRDEMYRLAEGLNFLGAAGITLLGKLFGLRRDATAEYKQYINSIDRKHPIGRLLTDSCIRRWVDALCEQGPPSVWQAQLLSPEETPAYHCSELPALFHPSALHDWLQHYARTGQPGWPAYGTEKYVLSANLDGTDPVLLRDPLRGVRAAFGPAQ